MRKPLFILALAALLVSCATSPEQKRARQERVARERAQWKEANYQYWLEDYAHRLGKAVAELSAAEREEARHIFNRDHPQ